MRSSGDGEKVRRFTEVINDFDKQAEPNTRDLARAMHYEVYGDNEKHDALVVSTMIPKNEFSRVRNSFRARTKRARVNGRFSLSSSMRAFAFSIGRAGACPL